MPRKQAAKQTREQQTRNDTATHLELDDSEVFRIIDKSDILNGQFGGVAPGTAYEILRPSQLNPAVKQADEGTLPGGSATRKLVELIDGEEDGSSLSPAPEAAASEDEEDAGISEFGEEMFRFVLNMIVFGTLWLCLDIMIHAQYGQETTMKTELGRAVNVLPGLGFVIYFTSRYSSNALTKAALVAFSVVGGSHMIYCINTQSYLAVMKRCPALGTLWIWSVVQLDLILAVASLAAVTAFVKWKGLHIVFS